MRIRSIKPEFYVSESVGRLTREARLLFIGLWSFADDSGRGRGALPAISGALYPYDADALKLLPKWFAELEAEGMVRRYKADDGNTYYDIPKWLNHQRIEKPSKSKFPEFTERSRNTPGIVGEGSRLDQGAGIREQGSMEQGKNALPAQVVEAEPVSEWEVAPGIIIPDGFQTPQCKEAILFWLDYKKEKRQGYKPQGLKALMSTIQADFTPETLLSAVRKSAAAGWQGLFPPNAPPNGQRQPPRADSESKQIQEDIQCLVWSAT